MISLMETEFTFITCAPPTKLKRSEVKDMYDLIGIEMVEEDYLSWGFTEDKDMSDYVCTFIFEREHGHALVESLEPHKQYPVMYIKVAQ